MQLLVSRLERTSCDSLPLQANSWRAFNASYINCKIGNATKQFRAAFALDLQPLKLWLRLITLALSLACVGVL